MHSHAIASLRYFNLKIQLASHPEKINAAAVAVGCFVQQNGCTEHRVLPVEGEFDEPIEVPVEADVGHPDSTGPVGFVGQPSGEHFVADVNARIPAEDFDSSWTGSDRCQRFDNPPTGDSLSREKHGSRRIKADHRKPDG